MRRAVATFLRDDPALRLDYCSNVTGVDWLDRMVKKTGKVKKIVDGVEKEIDETTEEKIPGYLEAVYHLYSMDAQTRPCRLSGCGQRDRADRRAFAFAHACLAQRGISGARNFRSLRHPIRRSSRSAANSDVGRIRRIIRCGRITRAGRLRIRTDAARRRAGKSRSNITLRGRNWTGGKHYGAIMSCNRRIRYRQPQRDEIDDSKASCSKFRWARSIPRRTASSA